jgi:hypothetical protein
MEKESGLYEFYLEFFVFFLPSLANLAFAETVYEVGEYGNISDTFRIYAPVDIFSLGLTWILHSFTKLAK